jgi:molybdopterin synthase catalytic subunit
MGTSEVLYAGIRDSPLDAGEAMAAVESPECGAVVTFNGVVRNHDSGATVFALTYSAHPSAELLIAEMAIDVAQKYDCISIWVAHRIGSLKIGDAALVAAVASYHRAEAFAAISELVETVKERVPIWKEQHFSDGNTEWVGVSQ